MILFTLGILGLLTIFGAMFLVPVWIGAMTYKEALITFAIAIAGTGFLFLTTWAFVHGYNQLFT